MIEARGIPTLVVGTARDIMEAVPPPRAVFVDFPVARTFGRPGDARQHEAVLGAALGLLPAFTSPGQILHLPAEWAPGGDRSWEAVVRRELGGSG